MCLQRSTTLFDPFENLEFAQESSKAKNCLVGPRVIVVSWLPSQNVLNLENTIRCHFGTETEGGNSSPRLHDKGTKNSKGRSSPRGVLCFAEAIPSGARVRVSFALCSCLFFTWLMRTFEFMHAVKETRGRKAVL